MKAKKVRRFLYILRSGPYGDAAGQEGLEAILAASAMELDIGVLFIEDGVFLVKSGQQAGRHGLKQYTKAFAALEDLGVSAIYVDELAMLARGLEQNDLTLKAQSLDIAEIKELVSQQDRVFTF